jgi:hypothetical protein
MTPHILRKGLPPLPARMARLEIDKRGYPVPWFVQWVKDEPKFNLASAAKFRQAIRFGNCWICGERVGARKTFVMGPLNILNRITSEPACHFDCARFAAMACPFLILPKAEYKETPQGAHLPPNLIQRNPGVCALWTTKTFKIVDGGQGKRLIQVSDPVAVDWYAMGKPATRAQVKESLDDGLLYAYIPISQGPDRIEAIIAFENAYAKALHYLPHLNGHMFADGF